MAFDPDEFLARTSGAAGAPKNSAGFDPDAFLARTDPWAGQEKPSWLTPGATPPKPPPQEYPTVDIEGTRKELRDWKAREDARPTRLQAYGRALAQGATLGHADEIAGLISSFRSSGMAFPNMNAQQMEEIGAAGRGAYTKARDEWREKDEAAFEGHKGIEIGGKVIGSMLNPITRSMGPATSGGLSGAGESKADLTKGEFLPYIQDAVVGTATGHVLGKAGGAAVKGVEKAVSWAGNKVAAKVAERVLKGVSPPKQDKALQSFKGPEHLSEFIRGDKTLDQAAKKGAGAFGKAVKAQVDDVGEQIGSIYKGADEVSEGIPQERVLQALGRLRERAAAARDLPAVRTLENEIKGLEELGGGVPIKAVELHKLAQRYGRAGFKGEHANLTDAKKLGRDMNDAVKGVLQKHVDDVAEASGGKLAGADKLQGLNARYSKLTALKDLAAAKVKADARIKGQGLGAQVGRAIDVASGVGSVAGAFTMGPAGLIPLAVPVLRRGIPAAPGAAASAINYGATGALPRQIRELARAGAIDEAIEVAIKAGVPRTAAEMLVKAQAAQRERKK